MSDRSELEDELSGVEYDYSEGSISKEEYDEKASCIKDELDKTKTIDPLPPRKAEIIPNETMMPPMTPFPLPPPIKRERSVMEPPPPQIIGYLDAYMDPISRVKGYESPYKSTIKRPEIEDGSIPFDDNTKMRFGSADKIKDNIKNQKVIELPSIKKKGKWPTDSLRNFLYNVDNESMSEANDKYQDPTWLGFEVMIISDESPLYGYGFGSSRSNSSTVYKFLDKYGKDYESGIPEMVERKEIYLRFIKQLMQYFSVSSNSDEHIIYNKRHYIEMISGLDKLTSKMVKYEDDFIEIQINEDISLRAQYMIDLYNNLVYDYKNKRNMIPENLTRFNMYIKIKDIRPIKIQNPTYDPDNNPDREVFQDALGGGETYTLYKLYDCNFDFSDSQTHEGTIQMAGWSSFNVSNMNNTKFKIKYKSISKVFESTLVNDYEVVKLNSHNLEEMYLDYGKDDYLVNLFNNNDYSYMKEVKKGTKAKEKIKPTERTKMGKLLKKVGDSDVIQNKFEDIKKLGDSKIQSVTNGIKGKFSEVRGALITDLKKSITDALPWDRLGNVYSTNFRQMSIENFGKELASDVIDTLVDPSELMELTNVSIKPPTIDGGFSKPKTAFSKNGYLGNIRKLNNQTNKNNYKIKK